MLILQEPITETDFVELRQSPPVKNGFFLDFENFGFYYLRKAESELKRFPIALNRSNN